MNNKFRNITLKDIKTPKNPHDRLSIEYFMWELGIGEPEYYHKLLFEKIKHQTAMNKKIKI